MKSRSKEVSKSNWRKENSRQQHGWTRNSSWLYWATRAHMWQIAPNMLLIIHNYGKFMSSIDYMDQMWSYCTVGHLSYKWWQYILHYLINLSMIQTSLTGQKSAHKKSYDHLKFSLDFAAQLWVGFSNCKQTGSQAAKEIHHILSEVSVSHHVPVGNNDLTKACC